MGVIFHKKKKYGGTGVKVQSDASATSLNPLDVPNGQTMDSYLNTKIAKKTVTVATSSGGMVAGSTADIFGVANAHILSAYLERVPTSLSANREANVKMYGTTGYQIECKQGGNLMTSTNVTLTIFYTLI